MGRNSYIQYCMNCVCLTHKSDALSLLCMGERLFQVSSNTLEKIHVAVAEIKKGHAKPDVPVSLSGHAIKTCVPG